MSSLSDRIARSYHVLRSAVAQPASYIAHHLGVEEDPVVVDSSDTGSQHDVMARTADSDRRQAIVNSPWSFLTSSFMLSIVIMSILVNRIHHLVPPRLGTGHAHHPEAVSHGVVRARTRLKTFLLRLPSLLLLLRAVLCVASLLADHKGYSLSWLRTPARLLALSTKWAISSDPLTTLIDSPGSRSDWPAVMWTAFVATSSAVVTEAFVRSLQDDLVSQSSFNILSFSFMLHVYSATPPNVFPKTLLTHLLITLLEIFFLHLSFALPCRPLRWPITAVFTLTGQFFALRAWMDPTDVDGVWDGPVWLNRIPGIIFEGFIVLTISLKLVAALLRGDPLTSDNILGHEASWPRMREDFAVSVIRYGSLCLESTTLSGLAHEVSPIRAFLPASMERALAVHSSHAKSASRVELSRTSVNPATMYLTEPDNGNAFANEITRVDVSRDEIDPPTTDSQRFWGVMHFLNVTLRIVFFFGYVAYSKLRTVYKAARRKAGREPVEVTLREGWTAHEPDDSDSSFTTDSSSDSGSEIDDDDVDESEAGVTGDRMSDSEGETSALIRDVTLHGQDEASLLVAHLTHQGGPMTRSAFGHGALTLRRRRPSNRLDRSEDDDERIGREAAACVVCTVEQRTIICWPCRCLNLCEDCRSQLARQSSMMTGAGGAGSQLCPTCRAPVKGFSRIFVP